MKRTTKYVALDVHQATTVAAVREQSGRVIARSILPTEPTALVEFFRGMRGSINVTFEEGTQAQWLHDLLAPVVNRVIVCDRRGEHRGNKADRIDADKLSHRLRTGAYSGRSGPRIPGEVDQRFRSKWTGDSDGSGPPVPGKWAGHSGRCGPRGERSRGRRWITVS